MSSRLASFADWRTPPAGLWPARLGEFLTLRADFRVKGAKPTDPTGVFAALCRLLGDHTVRLFSASIRDGQESLNAGWRPERYGHAHKVKLSELANAARWRAISEPAGGLQGIHCSANRGRGETAHTAWFLHTEQSFGPVGFRNQSRIWLTVAAQHISADTGPACTEPAADELTDDINRLVDAFFDAACGVSTVLCGAGEVIQGDPRCHDAWAWVNGVRFGDGAVNVAYGRGGPFLRFVAAYNLFRPAMTRRLGGVKKLQRLVVDFDARALPRGGELDRRLGLGPAMRARPIGRSCAVAVYPLNQRLEPVAHYDRDDPPKDLWLSNELARAGLLEHQHTGWQEQHKRRVLLHRRELLGAHHQARDEATPPPPAEVDWESYLSHMRAARPACIRQSTVVDRWPWATQVPHNCVVHLIGAPSRALSIYGGTIDEGLAGLSTPLLVGSLNRRRAACWFDDRVHGHDGFMEAHRYPSGDPRARSKPRQLACPECQGRLFHAWVQLEYPDDFEDFRNEPEYPQRHQLFSWFYLHAECAACGWHDEVASVECG